MAILDAWLQLAKDQGPVVGVLILLSYYFLKRSDKAYRELVDVLKEEIERLVKSRNRLEDIVLKNRQSSADNDNEVSDDD